MNSELRSIVRVPAASSTPRFGWHFESFLNLPLLFGFESKGVNAGQSTLDTTCVFELGPLAHACVRGLDPSEIRYLRRMTAFEQLNQEVLRRCPAGVDFYVPSDLGGLGLPRSTHPEARPHKFREDVCLRAAWLSTLDTRKRIRCTQPPVREPTSVWEHIAQEAQKSGLRSYTVISEDPENPLPPRLAVMKLKFGDDTWPRCLAIAQSILGPIIDRVRTDTWQEWIEALLLERHTQTQADAILVRLVSLESERQLSLLIGTLAELEWSTRNPKAGLLGPLIRQRREHQFALDVKYQLRKAKASSLSPMNPDTFVHWVVPHRLLERNFHPRVRSDVIRFTPW